MLGKTLTERQAKYAEYRKTPEWQEKRKAALERAGHRCQVCNSAGLLDVHHRHYDNIFNEDPGDLTVLCRGCHTKFHGKGSSVRNGESKAQRKQSKRTKHNRCEDILSYLLANPGASLDVVAIELGLGRNRAAGTLGALRSAGRAAKVRGCWWATKDGERVGVDGARIVERT